jgi:hypothetical protein
MTTAICSLFHQENCTTYFELFVFKNRIIGQAMRASFFISMLKKKRHWILILSTVIVSVSGLGQVQTQTFTSSGTFTVPAGVTSLTVECWGAGGAGGGSNSNNRGGSGGGGGGYTTALLTVTPGQSIPFVVGDGGTGVVGGTGNSGTTTSFLTLIANGGAGGEFNRGAAGSGGTASGGTTNITGSNGIVGTSLGGDGGNGANGGAGGTGISNGTGGNGTSPGGGGGGGERGGGSNYAGGNGGSGQITISYCVATSMGYSYERNITIDHTKVSGGTDLYNFPVLINLTGQTFLKSYPTGQILNSNGFDIIFTDGNYNKLDHQIEYYNGTNGDLIAWVRIPTLSYSSNTVIKILYGNSQVSTDPSVTSVWDSHYKGVWHLDNDNLNDYTSYNKSGTSYNSPTYPTGSIYNSLGMNGTNQYVEVINDPNINFAGNITVSAWVNMNVGGRDQKIAGNQNNSSGGYKFGIYTNNKVEFEIRNSANTPSLNRDVAGGTVLSTGTWYYLAGISSDVLDSIKTFVNGIPERPFKKTGILGTASSTLTIGKEPFLSSYYFSGRFDEIRISDEVRSNSWMRTEYNNQSSPSTFYSVDATGASSNYLPSESLCTGPITLTFGYPAGGTYSGNPYISGNIFTPPSVGTYTITYTYSGCGTPSVSKDFIITGLPASPVAPNQVYCTGQITYLQATTGQNIRWYSGSTLLSTANPFSTGQTVPGTYNYTVTQTVNGCESAPTSVSLTILTGITINTQPLPATICDGNNTSFSVVASGYNITYQWQENGVNIVNGGIYGGVTTATLNLTNPGTAKNGKLYRCVISSSCGTSPVTSNAALLTVNPLPVATFSYTGTPYCPNAANPLPTFSGGGVAGTFSSTPGLVFVNTATGQVNLAASTPGTYTVTNTIAASGGCSVVIATSPITIISNLSWTGAVSTDWNVAGNWSCGLIPNQNTSVQIPNVANKPVLSTGAIGTINDLIIDIGSSLTVSGNTIQIAGTITNNGTLTATAGSVQMNGSAAQLIGANTFSGNTVKDMIINNPAGVTLLGPLNITGVLTLQNGTFSSGGNLTLISAATQTALIAGSGSGTITGNLTMQRYLSSGFGYKYFSSPFQSATVNEFADDMALGPYTFYKYDESRTGSGWVSYNSPVTNTLIPLQGYAINFGAGSAPNTVDITGVVNNGIISATLYNHDNTYTKGFNLVGNPYPSPIDWNAAAGWTKSNIDNALYYFKASTTDQYGGTYATYIGGVSSDGVVNNIIPSMQGFFIHVSDGSYPVTGTLALNNSVRINDLTHPFASRKGAGSEIPLIRLTARFSDDMSSIDPTVIYFDEKGTAGFDNQLDAFKLLNTDLSVPNLYTIAPDGTILSINALPLLTGDLYTVPLGLKLNRTGTGDVVFKITYIDESLSGYNIYLTDIAAGTDQNLMNDKEYIISMPQGEYNNRFYLNLSNITTGIPDNNLKPELFSIYSSEGIIKAEIYRLQGKSGTLNIYNLSGQIIYTDRIYTTGYHEFNPGLKEGIYIVNYTSGTLRVSKKLFIQHR